ncbi:hypothetical protein PF005_g20521 [Phytophthora fragariae]|nr:hypothetical protein PF009_g21951 [Phytophthora fragariae]KAE9187260.1 hypothetical protein PF005_g20521 [Phytophthora fragariae]KAE9198955.1 hypothetical protein PF004_g19408 [Phytophthora fragariae]
MRVGDLKNAIKEQRSSVVTCEVADVTLYLAKKGTNWLKEGDADAKMLLTGSFPSGILGIMQNEENQMSPARRVDNAAFGFPEEDDEEAQDDVVHVLAAFPGMEMRDAPKEPHPLRKRRWDQLNEAVDRNKREKQTEIAISTDDSSLPLDDIQRVLGVEFYEQPSKPIPDERLDVLHDYLRLLAKAYENSVDLERLHFIVPVLTSACSLFDDVRIHADETVAGDQVAWNGKFEFVLERGNKFVCVVDAKHNIRQGLARAYVGSEVVAEATGLTKVYSIVTSFSQWFFLRSLNDKTEQSQMVPIALENGFPTRESVKEVVERIYALLSEDD